MIFNPGDILFDKYRIEALLGQGSFGTVYRVTFLPLNQTRAVKLLRREGATAKEFERAQQRFMKEVLLGAQLNDPNPNPHLWMIYEPLNSEELAGLAMEYAPGGSLAMRIQQAREKNEPIPLQEALQIALDVAGGLATLHERDIIHRDVKPANILFDGHGRARLADLGLVQTQEDDSYRLELSNPKPHPGTPGYMSPEQESSVKPLKPPSDVYALGLVLFEMLTGKLYYNQRPGTLASSLRADVPPALDQLLGRMLSKDPEARPWNAEKVVALLQAVDTGRGPEKPKPGFLARNWLWISLLCLALILAGFFMTRGNGAVPTPAPTYGAQPMAALPTNQSASAPVQITPINDLSNIQAADINLIPTDLGSDFQLKTEVGKEGYPTAKDASARTFQKKDALFYVTSTVIIFNTPPNDQVASIFDVFKQNTQKNQPNSTYVYGDISPTTIGDRGGIMSYAMQNTTWKGFVLVFFKANVMVILDELSSNSDISADEVQLHAKIIEGLESTPRHTQALATAEPLSLPTLSSSGNSYQKNGITFSSYTPASGAFRVDLPATNCTENQNGISCQLNTKNISMTNVLAGSSQLKIDDSNSEALMNQMLENLKPIGMLVSYSNLVYLGKTNGMYAYSFDFIHQNLGAGKGRIAFQSGNGKIFVIQFITFDLEKDQVIWDTAYNTFQVLAP